MGVIASNTSHRRQPQRRLRKRYSVVREREAQKIFSGSRARANTLSKYVAPRIFIAFEEALLKKHKLSVRD